MIFYERPPQILQLLLETTLPGPNLSRSEKELTLNCLVYDRRLEQSSATFVVRFPA